MAADKKLQPIIIKKVKKGGHSAHTLRRSRLLCRKVGRQSLLCRKVGRLRVTFLPLRSAPRRPRENYRRYRLQKMKPSFRHFF